MEGLLAEISSRELSQWIALGEVRAELTANNGQPKGPPGTAAEALSREGVL